MSSHYSMNFLVLKPTIRLLPYAILRATKKRRVGMSQFQYGTVRVANDIISHIIAETMPPDRRGSGRVQGYSKNRLEGRLK